MSSFPFFSNFSHFLILASSLTRKKPFSKSILLPINTFDQALCKVVDCVLPPLGKRVHPFRIHWTADRAHVTCPSLLQRVARDSLTSMLYAFSCHYSTAGCYSDTSRMVDMVYACDQLPLPRRARVIYCFSRGRFLRK